jgi:hypothetical protein
MLATIQFRIIYLLVYSQKNLKIKIYKTIILPAVFYGYETWCLTLREQRRLCLRRRALGRIFEPKREEAMEGWRR